MKKLSLDEIGQNRLSPESARSENRFPIYVLLDNLRSLHNVGSIFRTSDAVRVKKLILSGITGYPPRREIDKTALGAVETVPWSYASSGIDAVKELRSEGIPIIALEHTTESKPHWEIDYPFPCCLVIGNEVFGVQDEILELVDICIEIPMFGAKHSLNASVAFGIVVYSMLSTYLPKNPSTINSTKNEPIKK